MENWLIFLRILGEAELILRIWGAKENCFQGTEEISFRDLGRSLFRYVICGMRIDSRCVSTQCLFYNIYK